MKRREPVAELRVGCRIRYYCGSRLRDYGNVFALHLHAVCKDRLLIEKSGVAKELNRRLAVLLQAVCDFNIALGQMRMLQHMSLFRFPCYLLIQLRRAAVDRVRCEDELQKL